MFRPTVKSAPVVDRPQSGHRRVLTGALPPPPVATVAIVKRSATGAMQSQFSDDPRSRRSQPLGRPEGIGGGEEILAILDLC